MATRRNQRADLPFIDGEWSAKEYARMVRDAVALQSSNLPRARTLAQSAGMYAERHGIAANVQRAAWDAAR